MVILFFFSNAIFCTGFGIITGKRFWSFNSDIAKKSFRNHFHIAIWKFRRSRFSFHFSVSVFLSTLAKPEFRSVMLVGSCTAWSMESSLMARCPVTRQSVEEMIPSTHFSARLEQENTFLAPSLLIWNQLLWVRGVWNFLFISFFELKF